MRRIDNTDATDRWLKVLITGSTGTGKTWFGASAPNALILLSEYQGKASIDSYLATHPDRKRPAIMLMQHAEDFRDVLRALHKPKTGPFQVKSGKSDEIVMELEQWPQTIVLDSLTDALDLVRQDLWGRSKIPNNEYNLPDETFSHRRALLDQCAKFIRAFRDLPFHVVFLSLLEERDIYRNRKHIGMRQSPLVPHKDLAGVIASSVNVCGLSYRTTGQKGTEYGVLTEGVEGQPTKRMAPIRQTEVPDFSLWVNMVLGFWDGPLPQPPAPSEDVDTVKTETEQAKETVDGKD